MNMPEYGRIYFNKQSSKYVRILNVSDVMQYNALGHCTNYEHLSRQRYS